MQTKYLPLRKFAMIASVVVLTSCGGGSGSSGSSGGEEGAEVLVVNDPSVPTGQIDAIASWDGASWADYSAFIGTLTPAVRAKLSDIAALGVASGRQAGRMGQIGDSITESSAYFRNAVMNGLQSNETGHDYNGIRSWLAYSGVQPADANSFYRDHGKGVDYANKGGWTLANAIAAGHPAMSVDVGDGLVPGNFAWVLIMFGTNDIDSGSWDPAAWKASYQAFVEDFIALGIIPVLSTIPPERAHVGDGRVEAANQKVAEIATELDLLLVDSYALILHYQPTNWDGTLISGDGTHPSAGGGGRDFSQIRLTQSDGYAARTKLTFDVAEFLRDEIFEPATP
jgi:hypothetical protein